MIILGIDPGQGGGIAMLEANSVMEALTAPELILAERMPVLQLRKKKVVDAPEAIRRIERAANGGHEQQTLPYPIVDVAIVESVSAMPQQGVSSTFQFGRALGAIEAVAQLTARRVEYVTPAVWKRSMGLVGQSKRSSLDLAKLKFGPLLRDLWGVQKNDGIAEAALMCLWFLSENRQALPLPESTPDLEPEQLELDLRF